MKRDGTTVWGIHAGKLASADSLFVPKGFVALGWPDMGDLGSISPTRDSFRTQVAEVYPNVKPGVVPNNAGQLYRFVVEMKVDDLVAYATREGRLVHIGRVSGPYRYDPTMEPSHPNVRPVEWLRTLPRSSFTQGALYELGAAMSFFQIKTYADEFRIAASGSLAPEVITRDDTVTQVAADIEQTTKDYVLKILDKDLKGHPFAELFAHLLNAMGWRTRVSPPGPDQGVDIIAHRDELGLEPPRIKVQAKSGTGSIGDPVVKQLYGSVGDGEYGMVVTTSFFTPQAKMFANQKTNLRLIDGDELLDLIFEHYHKFEARYKGLLPLKRVYVPEPLEEPAS